MLQTVIDTDRSLKKFLEKNGCLCLRFFSVACKQEDMGNSRRVKGRTGWPQHVWASELKQEH